VLSLSLAHWKEVVVPPQAQQLAELMKKSLLQYL
jgi:hypothetical protein